jgi:hypothetical protein
MEQKLTQRSKVRHKIKVARHRDKHTQVTHLAKQYAGLLSIIIL